MDEHYRIVFMGELKGRIAAEEVIERLVATFKIPEAQARSLVLDGNRHVVKKDLNERRARRYRDALEKAGMIVHVEPMVAQAEALTLAPMEEARNGLSESPKATSAPAFRADFEPSRCPACGSMRVENGVCRDCGVEREEYLAGQGSSGDQANHSKGPATGSDPYQTPRADLRTQPQEGAMRGPSRVPASHGWDWIARGFWHFKTNPAAWILTLILFVGISIVVGLVPMVGPLVTSVLSTVFTGGIMLGAREQERGEDFRVGHLFAGFRDNLGSLSLVGLLYLLGGILVAALIGGLMFGSMMSLMVEADPFAFETQDPALLFPDPGPMGIIALLVGTLLFVPLVMAVLFAPALVMLDGLSATAAMKQSFVGCLKNILPFLIYGIIACLLLLLAIIPLGLGLLVVWPILTAAIYVAYRDIFFE